MKWLILVFALLVAGAILGPISSGNAGYVLVQFAGWSIETSVIALFILTVIAVVVISLCVGLVKAIMRRGRAGGQWFGKRRSASASRELERAQVGLLNHDYLKALQAFEKAYKYTKEPGTAALAAYAAQQCNELGKSEFWRSQAGKVFEQADTVIKIKYIESIKSQQPNLALTKLDELIKQNPDSALPWQLVIELYSANNQWQRLIELLPAIASKIDGDAPQISALEYQVYYQQFVSEGKKTGEALYNFWRSLTKSQRATTQVRLAYARALKDLNKKEVCGKVIYKGLKRGELTINEVNDKHVLCASYPKLVEYVQEALKRNAQHKGYIRALAALAYDSKDYSLAQRALKKLTESETTGSDYKMLGDVYHALGNTQLAANAYKKALA